MPYDFISLVNQVNKPLNEVELTNANFLSAGGWHSYAKDAVNLAIQDIGDAPVEWPFYYVERQEVLVPNQSRYDYPADCKKIDFNTFRIRPVADFDSPTVSLFPMDYESYLTQYSDMEYNPAKYAGLPTTVSKTNSLKFLVAPAPDYAYTLVYEYYSVPLRLEQPEQVPLIPRVFESVINAGAMYYAYLFREDDVAAEAAKVKFDDKVKAMRQTYINRVEYLRSTYIER